MQISFISFIFKYEIITMKDHKHKLAVYMVQPIPGLHCH